MNYKSLSVSLIIIFTPGILVTTVFHLNLLSETASVGLLILYIIWITVVEANPLKRSNGGDDYIMKCHWCDKECYVESIRSIHLMKKHPKFFEKYDEMNDWMFGDNIPEKPEGDNNED